jgi:Domain of unknown function (DUF4386)
MNSTKKQARVAGLLYLLASLAGAFSLLYVPSHFIVSGDAAATAHKIAGSELAFRLGILSELTGFIGFIFVVWALYRLLVGVSKAHASLMVTLMLISIPISLVNVLNETAALTLAGGANFLSVFDKPQRDALAMLFLRVHFDGFMVAQIFWGLWLIPFGVLVYKSGFLPRILGLLLILACFGYLANSLVGLGVLPSDVASRVVGQLTICELPIILWLVTVGAKDQPLAPLAS